MDEPTPRTNQPQPLDTSSEETYSSPSDTTTFSQPPMNLKKKSGAKKWLLWGLVLVLLAGASAFGYWQWAEAKNLSDELSSVKSELSTLKSAQETKTDDEDEVSQPIDKEAITAVVTAQVQASVASKDSKVTVNIMKQGAEFAYVSVSASDNSGFATIMKKVNDEWVIIYRGQEKPDKTLIDQYGIPTEYQTGQ